MKVTVIVQDALVATPVPQVLVSVKALAFVPVIETEVKVSAAVPVLLTVIV
jgi:hypothetical protein